MSTLVDILHALADQIADNITMPAGQELHVEPIPFPIAEAPNINMFVSGPTGLEEGLGGFGQTVGGIPVSITFRVPSTDIYVATDMALNFMDDDGDLSILAAIDADKTLGGVVDNIRWAVGFPWIGPQDFPTVNDDGIQLGNRLEIVIMDKVS